MDATLASKYDSLKQTIRDLKTVAVAFSGGVDSTLLAEVAHSVLGCNMMAITASLRSVPNRELEAARQWCKEQGIQHMVMPYDDLHIPGYAQNPPNRCYLCKSAVFSALRDVAHEHGMTHVVDGSNVDDKGDYRPGMRALAEVGVLSPLMDAGFTKDDVRALSRELSLPTWNMPSAACLASRFPYGEAITSQKLQRVEAAEDYLHGLGMSQVRVRIHGEAGTLARIEVPAAQIAQIAQAEVRERLVERLRELGFSYVSVDLEGFRSGAMNEVL